MMHHDLKCETTGVPVPIGFHELLHRGGDELEEAVRHMLPQDAIQKLRAPTSSSVPFVICTHAHDSGSVGLATALALFSLRACGLAVTYDEISDVELMPLTVTNGPQLTECFIDHMNRYYADEVTRRLHSDGAENGRRDVSHRVMLPIVEFASASLEQSYLRLIVAVADLDDSGNAHDEVGHVGAVTHDAVSPAGVQFFHLDADKQISCCFVTFQQLVADAHRWVMF